jgi:hypothetical protein
MKPVTRFLIVLTFAASFCVLAATHDPVVPHHPHEAESRKPHEVETRKPHEAPSRQPHAVAAHPKPALQAKAPKVSKPKH